ncbi:FxsB family cyclophane-forming radical SAM/SPASM peptide maturase [Sphaerisporangium perillae]|uniref:FxsB family cyclophane-forming radical SAM/SPASM peptide maturase n=1 Tax=Sphaerisporangium perillae TaxID=2935860 RepID=UPI00200F8419|nr:FxsB family cyclophane-forming radical SAM/SPASM peptide maturase [Sphaerisporangium perillae]
MPGNPDPESSFFPASLDVQAVLASGWRPFPFRQFILKIHSRCDLACRHCYVYEMADQSWRSQPRRMSRTVVDHAAERIAEHARRHDLAEVEVVLHGGEPLLAGPELISYAVQTIRGAADTGTLVHVGVQTNGVRLDDGYLELFDGLGVRIGVSLDGDEQAHDRHRTFANGRGSHAAVAASLRRLAHGPFHHLFSGLLCTIDVRNDPIATYEALLEFDPPAIDFLLPHGNWSAPPPFREPGSGTTPYADWLIPIFDRWYGAAKDETEVRFFQEIMRLMAGRSSRTEAIGLSPARMLVIETDGSIEQSDILKSSYPGAGATRLHVLRDTFEEALLHPSVVARQIGEPALGPACTACDIHTICGGGMYAHRYSDTAGFSGPSVYCPDLYRLITHIHDRFARDVALLKGGR